MSQPSRVFLYAEFQVSVPFCEGVWREANPARGCAAKRG